MWCVKIQTQSGTETITASSTQHAIKLAINADEQGFVARIEKAK